MSVQPQSMRLFFNRIQSEGGLPAAYDGTAQGSKWLLRKKGIQLSSCTPMIDSGTVELGTKNSVATNGTVEAFLTTISRSGRTKPDLDIAQKVGNDYVRVASPDLSAILANTTSYAMSHVHYDSVNDEFVVALYSTTTSLIYLLRVNATTHAVVGSSGHADSGGLLWPVTQPSPTAFSALSTFAVRSGVPYIVSGRSTTDCIAINLTARTAAFRSYAGLFPGAGYSSLLSGTRATAANGKVMFVAVATSNAVKKQYFLYVDPSGVDATTRVEIPDTAYAGSTTHYQRMNQGPIFLKEDGARQIYMTMARVISGGVTSQWFTTFDQNGFIGKTEMPDTSPSSFVAGTVSGRGGIVMQREAGTFLWNWRVSLTASTEDVRTAQYTFNATTDVLGRDSFTLSASAWVPNVDVMTLEDRSSGAVAYNAAGGYFVDCKRTFTAPPRFWVSTTGMALNTLVVSPTIGAIGGLVAQPDLALDAAYPAMYIPEEGSDLDPVSCSVLISKFVGGEFDGTLPDKNFMVNIANEASEDSNGKGKSKIISTVNINAMNSSCVLSGPGTVISLESVREDG